MLKQSLNTYFQVNEWTNKENEFCTFKKLFDSQKLSTDLLFGWKTSMIIDPPKKSRS